MDPLEMFQKVVDSHASSASQYIDPGTWRLRVKQVILRKSQRDDVTHFFVVEFTVVTSSRDDVTAGGTRTYIVNMSRESAPSNVKGFALALAPGLSDSSITKESLKTLVGPDQPAKGVLVDAEAWEITTRAGNPFTKVRFSAVDLEEPPKTPDLFEDVGF